MCVCARARARVCDAVQSRENYLCVMSVSVRHVCFCAPFRFRHSQSARLRVRARSVLPAVHVRDVQIPEPSASTPALRPDN